MKCLQLLLAVAAPVQAAVSWKNVKIGGGGGFVPGIVFHPTAKGVAYARTDIGGLYRLNSDDSWTAVTDSLATNDKWNSWGIDAVALDPQDANKVYAAVGMYTSNWDPNNGAIVRSSDKGATWSTTELPFKVGGNMPGRGMGERLAVDPHSPNIIYFGARSGNGLWKSTDGGASFSKVSSFTNTGTFIVDPTDPNGYNSDKMGLAFVTFDSTSSLVNGATSRIFVGTADNITASVYVSNDAGASWAAVPNQPSKYFPHKCRLQPTEKALYLTYSDGTGPYDGTLGGVYRYDLTNGTWKDITPVSGSDLHYGFGGLGVDMQKPGTLVVASLNSWWPDAQIFRSTDSGNTWSPIWEWAGYPNQNFYYGITSDKAPWINTGYISQDSKRLGWMIESLEINPLDSNHWLYGTGLTIYGGHDLTNWDKPAHNVSISSLADGIEEMAVLGLASAPGGPELLAAVGDDNGFTFNTASSLGTSPQSPWMNPLWATSADVDYAGNTPQSIVRIGNSPGTAQLAISTNAGTSWTVHPGADTTSHSGSVALSVDASTILWATDNSGVLRSQNQATFASVSSLPSSGVAVITSDKRNATVFYAGSSTGGFYRSLDSGVTFSPLPLKNATSIRDIIAHPTVPGTLLISTDAGVYHSTKYGEAGTLLPGLRDTQRVSFGVGSTSTRWNIYAFGVGATGAKLYASSDDGQSWVDIQGSQGFGSISSCRLVGSGNVDGQVYVGTNGRGVLFAGFKGAAGGGTSTSTSVVGGATSTSSVGTTTSVRTTSTTSTSVKITTTTTSTSVKVTTTSTTTSAKPTGTAVVERWGQCGGIGYLGPVACKSPWVCKVQNDYYSQCL